MTLSLEISKKQLLQNLPELELLVSATEAKLLLESLRENPEDIQRKLVIQKIVELFKRQKNMYLSCCVLLKELLPTLQTRQEIAQFTTTFNKFYLRAKNFHHPIERLQASLGPSESTLNRRQIQVEELAQTPLE